MNHSRAPGRRCNANTVAPFAPAAAISRSVVVQLLIAVGDHRQDRRDQHLAGQSCLARWPEPARAALSASAYRARGQCGCVSSVSAMDTPMLTGTRLTRHRQQRQIPPRRGALGQDRERCARLGQCGDDSWHQPVATFGALVGIGVRAERHRLLRPRRSPQFAGQHVTNVDLDNDLAIEVFAGVEIEVGVGVPRQSSRRSRGCNPGTG